MMTLAWIAAAFAGSVYINGVRADVLPEMTLEDVTVRIDGQGNLYIDAPGYRARVVSPPGYASPTPAPTYAPPATPAPSYAPTPAPSYTPPPAAPTYTPPPAAPTYAPPSTTTTTAAAASPAVPAPVRTSPSSTSALAGTWWLVSEDNDSTGHEIEVLVNGALVQRIRSGDPQVLFDLGPALHPGSNTVLLRALPSPGLGGGVLNVYVGRGSTAGGTLRIDEPEIRYARRATDRPSGASQSFTLNVP